MRSLKLEVRGWRNYLTIEKENRAICRIIKSMRLQYVLP
jgi:hypothetical protein